MSERPLLSSGRPSRSSSFNKCPPYILRVLPPIIACTTITVIFILLATFVDSNLSTAGWYSLGAITILLVVLITDVFEDTGIAFLFGLGLLMLGGPNVISVASAVDGYGDELVFAVALLSVVSIGIRESTLLNYFVFYVLGSDKNMSVRKALMKLLPPVMICSAFMSNTAIVAMMVPVVQKWSESIGVPARMLLLPMNFATLLGGTCTLIGTSVNLALAAMASAQEKRILSEGNRNGNSTSATLIPSMIGLTPSTNNHFNGMNATASAYEPLDFFEIGLIGLPCCVVGYIYLVIVTPVLLSEQASLVVSSSSDATTAEFALTKSSEATMSRFHIYTSCVKIAENLVGQTLEQADLLNLSDTLRVQRIVSVEEIVDDGGGKEEIGREGGNNQYHLEGGKSKRGRTVSHTRSDLLNERRPSDTNSSPTQPLHLTKLQEDNILVFTGSLSDLTTILYRHPYLIPVEGKQLTKIKSSFHKRKLVVAIVGEGSRLVNRAVSDIRFRDYYQAVIVAINRKGKSQSIASGVGSTTDVIKKVILKEGDSLLLEASDSFLKEFGSLEKVNDFSSVTQVSGRAQTNSVIQRSRPVHALIALSFVLFIAVGSATKLVKLPLAALIASFGLMFCRTISRKQAMGAVSARTLLVVGAGSGLTSALVQTGASAVLASAVASKFGGGEFRLLLLGLFIGTTTLSNVVSPMAAVSLMFPIAFKLNQANNMYRPEQVLGVLSIAGSCSFLSPFSYSTNLIVAETAGYTMKDFIKLGGPLLILVGLITVMGAELVWGDGPTSID